MPCCWGIETKLAELTNATFFNCFTCNEKNYAINNLPDGLQNAKYGYSGFAKSHGFRQWDEEEKLRNASSFVGSHLTTINSIFHL